MIHLLYTLQYSTDFSYEVCRSTICHFLKLLTGQSATSINKSLQSRAAVVHLNLRAGSTFPVPVRTVSPGFWVTKADTQ